MPAATVTLDEPEEPEPPVSDKEKTLIEMLNKQSLAINKLNRKVKELDEMREISGRSLHLIGILLERQLDQTEALQNLETLLQTRTADTAKHCYEALKLASGEFNTSLQAMYHELRTKCLDCAPRDTARHRQTQRHGNSPASGAAAVAAMLHQLEDTSF